MLQYIIQYSSEYYLSHSNFLLLQYLKSSPLPANDGKNIWQRNGIVNSLNQDMHIWVIPILLEKDAFKKNILVSLYSKLSDTYTTILNKLPFMNYIHWWTQAQML